MKMTNKVVPLFPCLPGHRNKGVAMQHRWMYGLFLVCVMLTRVTYTEYRGRHLGADRGQPLSSGGVHAESSERRGIGNSGAKRYLYAAFNDGSIHVYDIDEGHRESPHSIGFSGSPLDFRC